MSFDSPAFLLFLPLTVLLHWAIPQRWRWVILLAASYVFYAWWNISLSLLILSITAVSYIAARELEKSKTPRVRKFWLILALVIALALLSYFKYFNLIGSTATAVLSIFGGSRAYTALDIILPVGVSFYTFQALSYVIDVYRGRMNAERHFGYYALFISFFPQLVAGPIERAGNLLPQIRADRTYQKTDIQAGIRLLVSGFFRKIVIADLLAPIVNAIYNAHNPDGSAVFVGTILFGIQIYCDFAGYSEIAAGSARLLGIRLMRNFNQPYAAVGIRDFWRRWHISLSGWFTDYVYIPLGGSRQGLRKQITATFLVFALSGLWHGAEWSFVIWGLLHGFCMTAELLLKKAWQTLSQHFRIPRIRNPMFAKWCGRFTTLVCVFFAWIFFRAGSIRRALHIVEALFSTWTWQSSVLATTIAQQQGSLTLFIIQLLCMLPLLVWLPRLTREPYSRNYPADMTWVYFVLCIGLAWIIRFYGGGENAFIYFQF